MRALAFVLFVSALPVHAADVSGIWLGSLTTGRRGQVQDFAFQFVQKGTTLAGKLYLD
jgi:type III secretory pathway component EscS